MRTHSTGVASSIPPCVTFKTPLVKKATGNHLMKSTSLEKAQSPVSGLCYARNRVCNAGWSSMERGKEFTLSNKMLIICIIKDDFRDSKWNISILMD